MRLATNDIAGGASEEERTMTTKPKTRKAPAAKRAAPKAATKQASGEPKREARKIQELIARWKWLEADQDYQTAIAAPECDADGRHYAEQERIIAKLRTLVPQDYYELAALFKFALAEIEVADALRCDGADFDMLSNIHGALFDVLSQERETVLQKGMENMHEFLNKRTGAAFDVARDPETIKRIGWGRAA